MMEAESPLPRVLILGGVGFVGRHVAALLVQESLASHIRVVDKAPPATGWLNDYHKGVFQGVEFKQVNLANPASVEKAFHLEGGNFDYVINLAAETKYGQSEEVYNERVLSVAVNCARQAVKTKVKRFVHLSTAQVYDCDKGLSAEQSKVDPWTLLAKYHLKAELAFRDIEGLNYVILRPAIIYGVGDKSGITPRLVIAACYRELGEKMKLLWSKDLQMSTVHVCDVARASWHAAADSSLKSGSVYNLADKAMTTQGLITDLVSSMFKIQSGYFGSILSNLAKLHMSGATEESNEKHLSPWSAACARDGITNTPLSPYLDQELLYNKHLHVNGSKIEQSGFTYTQPRPTPELLSEVVDDYIKSGLFPPSLLS